MPELASVNGVVTPVQEARIPITDRGFLFGDAAYEVVRVYSQRPFLLRPHLQRLMATCQGMRFANLPTLEELEQQCLSLCQQSDLCEAAIFLHVSRGDDGQGKLLAEYTRPNIVIRCEAPPHWPETHYTQGVKLITVKDQRWLRGDLKTVNLLPRILAFEEAFQADAVEALWVDEEGFVREGLSCNVFAWLDDTLVTPPLTGRILPGITRQVILDLAGKQGAHALERKIQVDEILQAQEVFICSTTRELIPVVRIDQTAVAGSAPGARTLSLLDAYRHLALNA